MLRRWPALAVGNNEKSVRFLLSGQASSQTPALQAVSGSGFVNDVKGRFGSAAKSGEAG